jgi:hypothetical protein
LGGYPSQPPRDCVQAKPEPFRRERFVVGELLKSDIASCYNTRGDAFQAMGDLDRALAEFGDAVRLNPDSHFAGPGMF